MPTSGFALTANLPRMMNNKEISPLRIALIRQRYNPFGGAERFMERAIQSLEKSHVTLTLITRRWNNGVDSTANKLICNPFYIGSLWRNWSFSRQVCHTLGDKTFDLVQSHERLPCCDIYRAGDGVHREWLKQRQRVLGFWGKLGIKFSLYHRHICHAEKTLFHSPQLKKIICNSNMVKTEIQHYFGLPDEKFCIIYNGVDTENFHPKLKNLFNTQLREEYRIPVEATVCLYVGSGFERKGLSTVIKAFSQLPASTHLIVVGKDRSSKQYQRLAHSLGMAERTHFTGGQKDTRPFYGMADIFLLPTLYDPFPNAALEAMACGLPVITSTKSGTAELIESGKNGYVFDALDVKGISNALQLLMNSETRQRVGLEARTTVQTLTLDNMGAQLANLYQELLNR